MCKYLLEQNETQLDKLSCTQHYQQEPCTKFTLTPCEHSSKYGNQKKLVVIVTQFLLFKKRPNKNGKLVDAKQNKKEKKKIDLNIDLNGEKIQNWNFTK